jgi:hypothetical protein
MPRLYHGTRKPGKVRRKGLQAKYSKSDDEIFLSPLKGVAAHYGKVIAVDVPESMVVRTFEEYDRDPTKILLTPSIARTRRRTIAPEFISGENVDTSEFGF